MGANFLFRPDLDLFEVEFDRLSIIVRDKFCIADCIQDEFDTDVVVVEEAR